VYIKHKLNISCTVRRSRQAYLSPFPFPFLAKHKKKVAVFAYIIYDLSFLIELRARKKVSGTNRLPQNEAFSSSYANVIHNYKSKT